MSSLCPLFALTLLQLFVLFCWPCVCVTLLCFCFDARLRCVRSFSLLLLFSSLLFSFPFSSRAPSPSHSVFLYRLCWLYRPTRSTTNQPLITNHSSPTTTTTTGAGDTDTHTHSLLFINKPHHHQQQQQPRRSFRKHRPHLRTATPLFLSIAANLSTFV